MTVQKSAPPQLLSVAPMMDYTDVHYRQLARIITKHTWLYTEMVVDSTLIHNPDHDRFLWFPAEQKPIVCQLGGSNPEYLAKAAKIVAEYGYDEINLNCGCPSDRVAGAGCFGASLMLKPELVAQCCVAMAAAVGPLIPITVKCRIGVDDIDTYHGLCDFIEGVSENSPVKHFIVHARKCLLRGLSPHQNRTIPPLRYEWIWALKRDYPHLEFSLNGGVNGLDEVGTALGRDGHMLHSVCDPHAVTGVMIGRSAYHAIWDVLGDADRYVFGAPNNPVKSRREALEEYAMYADAMVGRHGVRADGSRVPSVRTLTKPLLGMFNGAPKGKKWRAAVDNALKTAESVSELLAMTLPVLRAETLDSPPTMMDRGAALAHLASELPLPKRDSCITMV